MSDEGDRDRALSGFPAYCSWSGGKDSALALHHAVESGAKLELLVTMLIEGGDRSRSHGLRRDLLEAQAAAIGVPIAFAATSWDGYEEALRAELQAAARAGLLTGVFGDIDISRHRDWVEAMAESAGTRACLPLWQRDRGSLMRELLDLGFRAVVVAVRDGVLPPSLLGETIDADMLHHFERSGVDLAGENGEFHTCVVDGPIFAAPVGIEAGETSLRDGVWFVDLVPRQRSAAPGTPGGPGTDGSTSVPAP